MLSHIAVALLIQFVGRVTHKSWSAGAFAAASWAISREITQAEYRWIEAFGGGHRANMPWWGGLDAAVWNKVDPWLDWMVPCALVTVIPLASLSGDEGASQRLRRGSQTR